MIVFAQLRSLSLLRPLKWARLTNKHDYGRLPPSLKFRILSWGLQDGIASRTKSYFRDLLLRLSLCQVEKEGLVIFFFWKNVLSSFLAPRVLQVVIDRLDLNGRCMLPLDSRKANTKILNFNEGGWPLGVLFLFAKQQASCQILWSCVLLPMSFWHPELDKAPMRLVNFFFQGGWPKRSLLHPDFTRQVTTTSCHKPCLHIWHKPCLSAFSERHFCEPPAWKKLTRHIAGVYKAVIPNDGKWWFLPSCVR